MSRYYHFIALCLTCDAAFAACSSPSVPEPQDEFPLSGRALLRGRILDDAGAPLDSFRVSLQLPSSYERGYMHAIVPPVTGPDGVYAAEILRISRVGGADSVEAGFTVQSLKTSDRKADGTPQLAITSIWIRFNEPPANGYVVTRDVVVVRRP